MYTLFLPDDEEVIRRNRQLFLKGPVVPKQAFEQRLGSKDRAYEQVLDAIGRHTRTKETALLDVGASVGHFLNHARSRGYETAGIELSQDVVSFLRDQGHRAYCGTLESLRLEDGSFDVVTYLEVFEHLKHPVRELSEIRRVLRKGGVLCLEVPNARFQLWKGRVEKCRLYQVLFDKPVFGLMPHIHFNHFTTDTGEKMLVDNGFQVLETMVREPTICTTRYPKGLMALLHLWIAFSQLLFALTSVHLSNAIVLIARKN